MDFPVLITKQIFKNENDKTTGVRFLVSNDFSLSNENLLVNALEEFQSLGVDFISYQENIDTTTPTGELIFHVMASLAQFESSLICQRVKAGMARAKAQGKHIARPPITKEL